MLTHRVPAGAIPLADLRAAGTLRAGHVLTVALAVADALVALAEAGLAHGGVAADQVLVGPDGVVVLGGCGLDWHRAPSDLDGPRIVDDVAALGELVRDLLGAGSSPSSIVLAALRAADPDPALRPSPAELLGLLHRCGRADPLLDLLWTAREPQRPVPGPVQVAAGETAAPPRRSSSARAAVPLRAESATPSVRLRIDPRLAPEPADEVPFADEAADPAPPPMARRAGVPRRPATRDRRRRSGRRWRGAVSLVVVSVLALLTLAAVRVGARAMADGPAPLVPAEATASARAAWARACSRPAKKRTAAPRSRGSRRK